MANDQYKEARAMPVTFLEKGIRKGAARILTLQLERRFGRLTEVQQTRLETMSIEQLEELACEVLTSQSLAELGLTEHNRRFAAVNTD